MIDRVERERSLLRGLLEEEHCGALYLTVVGAVADELLDGVKGPGHLAALVAERCSVSATLVRSIAGVMLDQGWVRMVGRRMALDEEVERELRAQLDADG